jgi:DNA-binding transcriptional MerR regulator
MFTIGKLADIAGVSSDTLRYYEREGLIEPAGKSPAGYRLYDKDSARRLGFIRHAQQCGFTLSSCRFFSIARLRTSPQRAASRPRRTRSSRISASRASLDGPGFIDTVGDEAIKRFAHRAHRADLALLRNRQKIGLRAS